MRGREKSGESNMTMSTYLDFTPLGLIATNNGPFSYGTQND